jgi:hypothetical protein
MQTDFARLLQQKQAVLRGLSIINIAEKSINVKGTQMRSEEMRNEK